MNLRLEKADPKEKAEKAAETVEYVVNDGNEGKGGKGDKGKKREGGAAYGGIVIDSWRMPVFLGSFSWETFW